MKLRLLVTDICERSCRGCCNKDWNLATLPKCENYEGYDLIMLTGGEPMLNPDLLYNIINKIRLHAGDTPIYLYTAKTDWRYDLLKVLYLVDGMTVTLHNKYDICDFVRFDSYRRMVGIKNKKLRLNVFKGVSVKGVDTSDWLVRKNITWIKNCPLPEDEVFMRF